MTVLRLYAERVLVGLEMRRGDYLIKGVEYTAGRFLGPCGGRDKCEGT